MSLGRSSSAMVPGKHIGGAHRILRRPLRIEREGFREIFRPDELRLQRDQNTGEQEQKPQRRRHIGSRCRSQDATA